MRKDQARSGSSHIRHYRFEGMVEETTYRLARKQQSAISAKRGNLAMESDVQLNDGTSGSNGLFGRGDVRLEFLDGGSAASAGGHSSHRRLEDQHCLQQFVERYLVQQKHAFELASDILPRG